MPKTKSAPTQSTPAVAKLAAVSARAEKASAARNARAREALAEIRRLYGKSAEAAWDLGFALGAFLQDKLYVALGFASFGKCLEAENLLSESQAFRLIRVARHYTKAELAKVGGLDKAVALLAYVDATPD